MKNRGSEKKSSSSPRRQPGTTAEDEALVQQLIEEEEQRERQAKAKGSSNCKSSGDPNIDEQKLLSDLLGESEKADSASKSYTRGSRAAGEASDEQSLEKILAGDKASPSPVSTPKVDTSRPSDPSPEVNKTVVDIEDQKRAEFEEADEVDAIDEKSTKDPLLLLSKYVKKTRLRSEQRSVQHLTGTSEYERLKVNRLAYVRYEKIAAHLAAPEGDRPAGRPTCMTVPGSFSPLCRLTATTSWWEIPRGPSSSWTSTRSTSSRSATRSLRDTGSPLSM